MSPTQPQRYQCALPAEFYLQETLHVAKSLLDCLLVRETSEGIMVGRISEVEAYTQDDPACHTFRGKTPRNAPMFEVGGTVYVYFTYGMYHCINAVTESEGVGNAVLIRAVEPLHGFAQMQRVRNAKKLILEPEIAAMPRLSRERIQLGVQLTGGPGKLCQAFGITLSENGMDFRTPEHLWISPADAEWSLPTTEIVATPRIGITKATELPWRFYKKDERYLSKP